VVVEEENVSIMRGLLAICNHSDKAAKHNADQNVNARSKQAATGEHAKAKNQSSRPFSDACKPAAVKRVVRVNFKV